MALIRIRAASCLLACYCACAAAQPAAAEPTGCGPHERAALAVFAERGIAELRGFLFAKRQLDQLAQYLESEAGSAKWAEATPASRLALVESATRSAAISNSAVARLPFLASTRYLFENHFNFECAKSAELLAQLREPGFSRYLDLRARVAATASAWYASGVFSRLAQSPSSPDAKPLAFRPGLLPIPATALNVAPAEDFLPAALVPGARAPRAAIPRVGAPKARTPKPAAASKPAPAEAKAALAHRSAAVDLLFRENGAFNVGMTVLERERLLGGALATAPTALLNDAAAVLADSRVQSTLVDPAYLAFNHAVMMTAHKAQLVLIENYPHLEPLSRNVSQAWAADFLRPAPKPSAVDPKPAPAAPASPSTDAKS